MPATDNIALVETEPDRVGTARVGLRIAMVVVAAVVLAADQTSKSLVLATHAGLAANPRGWFSIQLARNHGASTGIGANHPLVVTAFEIVGIVFVGILAARTRNRVVAIALALVLGGALGNVADRFVRSPGYGRGAVVDWIHLGWRGGSLDLADVAIQLGAILALVAVVAGTWADTRRRRHSS